MANYLYRRYMVKVSSIRDGSSYYDEDASYKKVLQEVKGFAEKAQIGKVYQISAFDDPFGAIAEYKEVPNRWFD